MARFYKWVVEVCKTAGGAGLMISVGRGDANAVDRLPVSARHGNGMIVNGGRLKLGRYVDMNSMPATNLSLIMAERLNVTRLNHCGNSTGTPSQL